MFEEAEKESVLNDIHKLDEGKTNNPVDLRTFFPTIKTNAIFLNKDKIFIDISKKIGQILDLRIIKIIKVRELQDKRLLDVFKKKSLTFFGALNPLKKKEIFHINPIDICEPIDNIDYNSINIRNLEKIYSTKTYPDIHKKPLNIGKKSKLFLQKNKKTIIKSWILGIKVGLVLILIVVSFVIFSIGLKNYIQGETIAQYQKIYNLKNLRDPISLKNEAVKIRSSFKFLSFIFAPINLFGNNVFYTNPSIKLANNVIKGGSYISETAVIFSNIYGDLEKLGQKSLTNLNDTSFLAKYKNIKITDFLRSENDNIEDINKHIKNVISYYSQISTLNDPALDIKFKNILNELIKGQAYLDFFIQNKQIIYDLLGDTKPQRYLVLNQNKDEIRANGGFPGSVITIDLYKGNIINYDKKDVYYYDWHIYPYRERPPEGLNIISPNHGIRDANYDPEFLESVNKINFFYEKGGGGSLNTVIGITQSAVEELLNKYGPIHMDEINMDITDTNFSVIMSILVENKFKAAISPKDILFKFTEKLESSLLEKKDFVGYLDILIDNIKKGEIIIASREKNIQNFIDSFNVFDQWKNDNGNWIYPVFTSISGNKSDRYISRIFELNSSVLTGCTVSNSLNLISTHTFSTKERDEIRKLLYELKITDGKEKDRLMGIEGAAENRQFVRVLVPTGSRLTNIYKQNIKEDNSNPNYTVFKFYLNTDVGKTSNIKFDYISTAKNCDSKLNFYKQPGLDNYEVKN